MAESSRSSQRSAPARKSGDARRRALTAKVHIAKKELRLGDDAYRDILQRKFGKPSSKNLTQPQLVDLVEHFKSLGWKPRKKTPARAGKRPMDAKPVSRKARALWISLYHLGCVSDPSESALAAFVKRQAGVDDLRFLKDERPVVEALKSWLARDPAKGGGGVSWSPYRAMSNGQSYPVHYPRARVMEAQWRMLYRFGAVSIDDTGALANWVERSCGKVGLYTHLEKGDADQIIETLGAWIRRAKGKAVA